MIKQADAVPILLHLHKFETARDSISIHEEATMWLFLNFLIDCAKAALAHRYVPQTMTMVRIQSTSPHNT